VIRKASGEVLRIGGMVKNKRKLKRWDKELVVIHSLKPSSMLAEGGQAPIRGV
jgi:hypothetical protein